MSWSHVKIYSVDVRSILAVFSNLISLRDMFTACQAGVARPPGCQSLVCDVVQVPKYTL